MKTSALVGVSPIAITDRTCESLTGVPWRTMRLELEAAGHHIAHVGRRPVVPVAVVLELLETKRKVWTEADTETELAAELARTPRPRRSGGVR